MVAGQNVAGQYHMVFYIYDKFGHQEEEASEGSIEGSIKGWKLRREDCCSEFREELRQALGGSEGLQGN